MKYLLSILALCLCVGCAGLFTRAPAPVDSTGIDYDVQTGLRDAGLIGDSYMVNGVVWQHTSDDFRANYVRLLGLYGQKLPTPPGSDTEGWILDPPPIACNQGVLDNMKLLKTFDRSQRTATPTPAK